MKEKRHRLKGLRDRFGKNTGVAVCESDFADELQRAEWTFVAVAGQTKVIDQTFSQIEHFLTTSVDAELIDLARQSLT